MIENYDLHYVNPVPAERPFDGDAPEKRQTSMSLVKRLGTCVAGAALLAGGIELAGLANEHPSHVRPAVVCETPPATAQPLC